MAFVLDLDPKKINLRQFGSHLASQINTYAASHRDPDAALFQQLAVVMNRVLQREKQQNHTHKFRDSFVASLSPKAAYYLMALGGSDLFTSSFLKIWEAQNISDLSTYVQQADPERTQIASFFLVIGQFGKINLFKKDPEFYLDTLKTSLTESRKISSTKVTAVWISSLSEIYPSFSKAQKENLANFLVDEFQLTTTQKSPQYQGAIAFWLAYLANEPYNLSSNDGRLKSIVATLPPIQLPKPADFLSTEDQAINGINQFFSPFWYGKSSHELKRLDWRLVENGSDSGNQYQIYQKKIKGRVAKMVLVLLNESTPKLPDKFARERFISNNLRMHSFETVSSGVVNSSMTIDGSCGGYSRQIDVDPFSSSPAILRIADKNIGKGDRNLALTLDFLHAIAYEDQDWHRLSSHKKHGIALPTDPGFLLAPYVRTYIVHESIKIQKSMLLLQL